MKTNFIEKPFRSSTDRLGLDTETIKGYCRLLCLSDGRSFRVESLDDVLYFIKCFMRVKKTYFFAWNADFDIQALLKYFNKRTLNALLKGVEILYEHPKASFSVQYIKGKYLQFDGNYIFDAYQYYHLPLKNAAVKYLGEGEGKLDVDGSKISEENIYSPGVEEYCKRDALAALKLFSRFHAALPEKLERTRPISNAFYAYSYFRSELSLNRPKPDVNKYFRNAYHGGRFEIFERGRFKGLYVYDINSAYPHEIARLPALDRAHYVNFAGFMPSASFSVLKVKVRLLDPFVGPLLVKDRGLCVYPSGWVESYITKGEYERIKDLEHEISEGFHVFCGKGRPFREKVEELYLKKQSSGFPLPFKIILNSLYGKTGQATPKYIDVRELNEVVEVVDYVDEDGITYVKFEDLSKSNFVYASEITARTRLRMYDVVKAHPESVVMVSTDSVVSTKALDLPLSEKMGDWKLEKWDEGIFIGSGLYFYRKGVEWAGKFRGFNFKDDKVRSILDTILKSKGDKVEFTTKKRFSIQEARRLHDEELGNQILDVTRKLNLNFDRKRLWTSAWKKGSEVGTKRIRSSAIYSQNILTP